MNSCLNIGHNWSFRLIKTPRACVSQESSRVALHKRQEKNSNLFKNDSPNAENPPLVSALKASAEQNAARFHFPGHNGGNAAPSSFTDLIGERPFLHDLPELPELDNLFSPEGPILEAQKRAAELFGASETWFLVGGSTCGVQTAIMATCLPGETLVLPRNCHISAISGMVLSGAVPKYIVPEYHSDWDIAGGIAPSQVEAAIKEVVQKEGRNPAAVFIVSPSYHGICSDIREISQLCRNNKIPLIVDEAHGAHFGFHRHLPTSALAQGADLVVQSTHKVLCSLTQSSMLHLSGDFIDREKICRCLQTLQSSSPSYLLLASLDAARAQISENPENIFDEAIRLAVGAKNGIKKIPGISVLDVLDFPNFLGIDPLRVTVGVQGIGLSGFEADEILCRDFGVVPELVGTHSITLVFNLGTKREHVSRLVLGLKYLSETYYINVERAIDVKKVAVFDNDIKMVLSPRDAFFASKRKVGIEESVGEICGELICTYPPGIPVLFPGEFITKEAVEYLLYVKRKGATVTGAADRLLSSVLVCGKY